MSQNSLIQIQVDDNLKKEADNLFSDLGLDTATAIRIFLKQAIKQHGLPFEVKQHVYNTETINALNEAEKVSTDVNIKRYSDFSELLNEVQNEV